MSFRILPLGLATTALLGLASCSFRQSPLGEFLVFESQPTYLCPGEEATASWRIRAPEDAFSLLISLRPGGTLGLPSPLLPNGSQSFLPAQPSDPGGVASTEITALATARMDGEGRITMGTENAIVIGSDASFLHVESFRWGCDAARGGGGAGWSSVDYERAQKASASVAIRHVRNLSPFAIRLGMRRGSDPLETHTLGVGETSTDFNGELYGVWEALPESNDVWGPDGCEEGVPQGGVLSVDDPELVIVHPRPDATVGFELGCPVI